MTYLVVNFRAPSNLLSFPTSISSGGGFLVQVFQGSVELRLCSSAYPPESVNSACQMVRWYLFTVRICAERYRWNCICFVVGGTCSLVAVAIGTSEMSGLLQLGGKLTSESRSAWLSSSGRAAANRMFGKNLTVLAGDGFLAQPTPESVSGSDSMANLILIAPRLSRFCHRYLVSHSTRCHCAERGVGDAPHRVVSMYLLTTISIHSVGSPLHVRLSASWSSDLRLTLRSTRNRASPRHISHIVTEGTCSAREGEKTLLAWQYKSSIAQNCMLLHRAYMLP